MGTIKSLFLFPLTKRQQKTSNSIESWKQKEQNV